MSKLILLAALASFSAAAADSSADWSLETRTLVVKGEAAVDLYYSLSGEQIAPARGSRSNVYVKKNSFATCTAKGVPLANTNEIQLVDFECRLQAKPSQIAPEWN